MRNPLSDKIVKIPPSGIRKFFDIVSEMKDAISLGVGEPDFETPWHIREEGIYSLEKGRTFYTSNAGLKPLKVEICEYLKRRCGATYDPDQEILVTVGGSEAIDIALRAMLNEGDEVLIPQPSYVSYMPCVTLADGVPVTIELEEKDQFKLTPEKLLEKITDKTKILILPFPNNPTGAIMEKEELEEIVKIVLEKDLFVISDEIYSELTYNGKRHVTIASFPGMKERTVLINGFSKAYAMTGWRLGYAAAPHIILEQMLKIHQYAIMCAPTPSQYAAVSAMKNGDPDVAMMRESYNQRRRFLLHAYEEMGLTCFEPMGAFYTFPNISRFGMTSEEFATRFLEEEKVAVVPGTAFGDCGEGFVRVSYAYSLDKLKEALETLQKENPSAVARVPDVIPAWLGLQAYGMKDLETADKYMTWATQNDQLQNVKKVIWRNLAKVRLALRKYDRALVASNNFLKDEDQPYRRADGMLDKASILLGLGKYADARKTAEDALALGVEGPLMASLKIVLGDISYAEKKFDEAAKHYGVTAELFVNDAELKPKALFKAAEALDKAGRKSEASQYRARLQKEFPDWKQDGESLPPDAR